jgi:cysteine desulfuration protein SufE
MTGSGRQTTPEEAAEELADAFEVFDDWEERYGYLIEMGRKLPPVEASEKTETNRVQGCQSMVWVVAQKRNGADGVRIDFRADSDSVLVKGLIAVLWRVYSGRTQEQILSFDIAGLLERIGLQEHLTLNRRNGLASAVQRIKALACAEA